MTPEIGADKRVGGHGLNCIRKRREIRGEKGDGEYYKEVMVDFLDFLEAGSARLVAAVTHCDQGSHASRGFAFARFTGASSSFARPCACLVAHRCISGKACVIVKHRRSRACRHLLNFSFVIPCPRSDTISSLPSSRGLISRKKSPRLSPPPFFSLL